MRKPGWEGILQQEIQKANTSEFNWGTNDCTSWSFKVLSKISDTDEIQYISELYTNKKSALKIWAEKSILDRVIERIGKPRCNLMLTKRGDLVLEDNNNLGETLGICIGNKVAFLGEEGLVYISLMKCKYSWEIK